MVANADPNFTLTLTLTLILTPTLTLTPTPTPTPTLSLSPSPSSSPNQERSRASSFGSTVAVLQTSAAALRWPVTPELNARLRRAFAASLPSAAAAAERQKRGGGDAVAKLLDRREGAIADRAKGEAATAERAEEQAVAVRAPRSKKKRPRPEA